MKPFEKTAFEKAKQTFQSIFVKNSKGRETGRGLYQAVNYRIDAEYTSAEEERQGKPRILYAARVIVHPGQGGHVILAKNLSLVDEAKTACFQHFLTTREGKATLELYTEIERIATETAEYEAETGFRQWQPKKGGGD